jgi:hypothetical protein
MLLGHAFEMLLKSVINESGRSVRDDTTGYSIGLGDCINICLSTLGVLTEAEAILLRSIKQQRDAAMHDTVDASDDLLWLHTQNAVTLFNRLLVQNLDGNVGMPPRSMPVSIAPPTDFAVVVDSEIEIIKGQLAEGRRQTAQATARIVPLLALDGGSTGRAERPTPQELRRAATSLKKGTDWRVVMPGLASLALRNSPRAGAAEVTLHISKKQKGSLAVRRAAPQEEGEALAYRGVDPFTEFSVKLSEYGGLLGLTQHQGYAVIESLGLKQDERCYYEKRRASGSVVYQGLSARALHLGREALYSKDFDLERAVREYQTSRNRVRRPRSD